MKRASFSPSGPLSIATSSRRILSSSIAAAVVSLVMASGTEAATYYWDAGDANPLNDSSAIGLVGGTAAGTGLGGTGAWDATSLFWFNPAITTDIAWPNLAADIADFMGTAGTVTITAGGINAGAVQLFSTGYTLAGGPLTLGAGVGASNTNVFISSGLASTISASVSGTNGLVLGGGGTLTLNASNAYTGNTTLNSGSNLTLDYTAAGAPLADIISGTSPLIINNGVLAIKSSATAGATAISQTFASTAINGASTISLTTAATATTLNLGAISHAAGGTLQFNVTPSTSGNVVTTTTASTNGILAPWAFTSTTTGLRYAAVNGAGQITNSTGTAAATAAALTDTTGTVNYELAAVTGSPAAGFSANTIRYNGAAGTLAPAAGFALNGLLNVGTGTLTIGTAGVTIGATNELVVNPGASIVFTSPIGNNGATASALTVGGGGTGTVTLSAVNTYTGRTTVNSGATLAATVSNAINSASPLAVNGGTLALAANSNTFAGVSLTSGTISGTGTITSSTAYDVQSGTINPILAGSSGLIKTTAGNVFLTPASGVAETFTGGVFIKAGVLTAGIGNVVNVLGSNTITLGDTSGSADARFVFAGTQATYANPIVLATGTTGQLSIGTTNNTTNVAFTGGITGNNNFTVTGAGTTGTLTFNTVAINNAGTLTNAGTILGTGTGATIVGLPLGALVTGINQSSATAPLTFSIANGAQAITTAIPINITNGTLNYAFTGTATSVANVLGTGPITITPGGNLSFSIGTVTDTLANTVTVANAAGTAQISTTSGGETFTGAVNFASGAATPILRLNNTNGTAATLTLSGPITGTGNLQLNPSSTGSPITVSGAQNQAGTISNVGSSSSLSTLSGTIGTGITGISQAGANPFTVSSAVLLSPTLNSFTSTGTGLFTISGAVTGTQNLTTIANGSGGITFSGAVNNAGTIINSGTGAGVVTFSAPLSTSITSITQNSATSPLVFSGTNPATAGQTFTATNGVLEFFNTAALPGYPAPSAGRVTIANGATLGLGFGSAGQFTDANIPNILSGALPITFSGPNANLGLDTATASTASAAVISNPAGINLGLVKLGANTLALTGASTFSGPVAIQNGTLSVSNINSVVGGTASSNLGAPTTAANGTISLGNAGVGGTLLYTGSGERTDRIINLAGTTGGATIDNSGSGFLKFTGNNTITGTGSKTLTLQGAGSGEFSGTFPAGGSTNASPLIVTKNGAGTWAFTGAGDVITTLNISGGIFDFGTNGVTIANAGGAFINATGNSTVSGKIFIGGGAAAGNGPDLGAAAGVTLNLAAELADGNSTGLDFYNAGGGTTILTGASTYANAQTNFNLQTVQLSSFNSVATNAATGAVHTATSNLGAPVTVANGTLLLSTSGNATLRYTGTGEVTDRLLNFSGATAGAIMTFEQSGTGNLKFLGNVSATGAALHVLQLQGSTAGTGEFAGAIGENSTTNNTRVVKTGTGTWKLSGVNTYTGATTISQGTLALGYNATPGNPSGTAGSLANTAISVAAGAAFVVQAGSGTIVAGNNLTAAGGASLALPAGASFSMVDGAIGTFSIVTGVGAAPAPLTLTGGTLNLEIGSTGADKIAITGGTTASSVTSGIVILTGVGSSLSTGSSYNLITGAGAGITAGSGPLLFGNGTTSETLQVGTNAYPLSLSSTAGVEIVTVGAAATAAVTYTGQTNGNGLANSNFSTALGNLNFASGTIPVDYANGNAVTFQDLNTATNTSVTNGTVVVDAAGVSPLDLVVNNSAVPYTFSNASGAIGITGTTGLAKLGSGTLTLNSPNSYAGVTVLGGGVLNAGVAGALGTGNISLVGGTLQYGSGNTQDYSNRFLTVGQTYNIDTNGQAVTFGTALVSPNAVLNKFGTGTLTLSGTNTYAGINTIYSGSLAASSDANLGTNTSATAILFPAGSTGSLRITGTGSTISRPITLAGNGGITLAGADSATFSGAIAGAGSFTKSGTGTLSISTAAPAFTGAVNITGGILSVAGNGQADPVALGVGAKLVTLTNGGVLRITSASNPNGNTKNFVFGAGGGGLDTPSGVTVILDDGQGNLGITAGAAQLQGSGDLTKSGLGFLQLGYSAQTGFNTAGGGFANFTGNIIASAGTLFAGNMNGLGSAAGSTTVQSGATLDFYSSTAAYTLSEPLILNGTGVGGVGALTNSSTAPITLSGPITLASNSAIGGLGTTNAGAAGTAVGTGNLIATGSIGGTGMLTKLSTNTLTLLGSNTFSGGLTIGAGSVVLGNGTYLGTLNPGGAIVNNGTLTINRLGTSTQGVDFQAGGISGTGNLTLSGNGTTVLNTANSYSGSTTVSAGSRLNLTSAASLGNTAITVGSGSTLGVFAGNGTVIAGNNATAAAGASLSLGAGSTFNMVDGGIGTFSLNQEASAAGVPLNLAGATLNLELGNTAADQITVTGGATASTFSGTNFVNITPVATALTVGNSYNIVTANGIAAGNTLFKFASGATTQAIGAGNGVYLLTLGGIAGVEQLTVSNSGALTFTGQTNGSGLADSTWGTAASGINNFATSAGVAADYIDGSLVGFVNLNPVTSATVTNTTVNVQAAGVAPSGVLVNSTLNYTFNNASGNVGIAGTGGLTKSGSGTLTLAGANTFTGGVTLTGGIVNLGVAEGAGSGPLGASGSIAFTGGTLQYSAANQADYSSRFSTAGGQQYLIDTNNQSVTFGTALTSLGGTFTKTGLGQLTLSAASNTYTGETVINNGTLRLTGGGSQAGVLAGTPAITVNTGGTLLLTAGDQIGYTAGKEALIINGGTVANNTAGVRVTVQNPIVMAGGSLSGTSTGDANTGAFSINGAFINATSDASGTAALISANISTQSNINFNVTRGTAVTSTNPDLTVSGPITPYGGNAAGIAKSGNGILLLSGANTYKGSTLINAGTLTLGSALALPAGLPLTLASTAGATLNLNNFNSDIGSLSGGGALGGAVALGSGILTTGSDNTSTTYGGSITGSGSFVKQGTGVQTITSNAAYTGATTVRGGTLIVEGSLSGTATVNVNNSGTLLLASSNNVGSAPSLNLGSTTSANLVLNAGSTAAAPFTETFGALTLSQNSTIDFGAGTNASFKFSSLTLDSTPATAYMSLTVLHYSGTPLSNTDMLFFTSNPNLSDAQLANFTFYNDNNVVIANGGHEVAVSGGYQIVPVPEPSTLYSLLMAGGLVSVLKRRRARKPLATQK